MVFSLLLRIQAIALIASSCHAFASSSFLSLSGNSAKPSLTQLRLENGDEKFTDRRTFLTSASAIACLLIGGDSASAKDELFRVNPLTNPLLEQVRIWEQAEADNLKYGGELEAGDAGNKGKVSAYPSLLAPILEIERDLAQVETLVKEGSPSAWKQALKILKAERFEKTNFKKTFNKYGDNIYYGDPDRANLYLGGGATPKSEQSMAYLVRNDILTNMEDLRAELEYLLKSGDQETGDLYSFTTAANSAMKTYLALVPPEELEEARRIVASS